MVDGVLFLEKSTTKNRRCGYLTYWIVLMMDFYRRQTSGGDLLRLRRG